MAKLSALLFWYKSYLLHKWEKLQTSKLNLISFHQMEPWGKGRTGYDTVELIWAEPTVLKCLLDIYDNFESNLCCILICFYLFVCVCMWVCLCMCLWVFSVSCCLCTFECAFVYVGVLAGVFGWVHVCLCEFLFYDALVILWFQF